MMALHEALALVPGAAAVGDVFTRVTRVHTDTRTVQPGDLFVALRGERFDAHDFLAQAKASGAVAALAEQGLAEAGLPGLLVADSRIALGQLATGWRAQFNLPLIAVTGSNGKTTVTQMIASVLRAWHGAQAFATEGNLNNDIGVPLTLLRLREAHQVGVVELGMNHPGEIAYLADIARPTVALINNAQREHLEFMETVDAVARENGSVLAALPGDGIAVFPADDDYTPLWREMAGARRVITFAGSGAADVTATAEWLGDHWAVSASTPEGALEFALHIAGRHNVKNALAAIACALAAGAPLTAIVQGLAAFVPVKGRSRAVSLPLGDRVLTLVDDSYNANPDSMGAAIAVLAELPGPRVLVMGDMGEVGDQGPQFHEEAGRLAKASGIERFFTLGAQAEGASAVFDGATHFTDMAALIAAVIAGLPDTASLLVKGSRFMKMEQVVAAVTAHLQPETSQIYKKKDTPHAA